MRTRGLEERRYGRSATRWAGIGRAYGRVPEVRAPMLTKAGHCKEGTPKHTQQQTPSFLIGPCFELGIRRPYYGDAQRTLCGPNPRDLSAEAVTHATRRFRPAAPPLRVAAAPAATPPASLATLAISTSFYYLLGIRPLVPRLLLSLPEATRLLKRARLRLADRR